MLQLTCAVLCASHPERCTGDHRKLKYMSKRVVIIGAGEIGLSLGRILKTKGYHLSFWDKNPKVLESLGSEPKGLPEIVPEADELFLCVPSWALREALLFVSPYLSKQTVVVAVSKGIEPASLKTADELALSILPKKQPFCLLSGMMVAEELREGYFGAGVIATKSDKAEKEVSDLFAETTLLTESSDDLHGVALCGVLKNIYALLLGLSYGLGLGDNARGLLAVGAVAEMKKILSLLGGRQETAIGPAGLGDLISTGLSSYSKNHEAGLALARGATGFESEGLASLTSLTLLLGEKYKKLPLLSALVLVVEGTLEPAVAFQNILYGGK